MLRLLMVYESDAFIIPCILFFSMCMGNFFKILWGQSRIVAVVSGVAEDLVNREGKSEKPLTFG